MKSTTGETKMKKFSIQVKRIRRKGVITYGYSFEVGKKTFTCGHGYKTEKSCTIAANKFVAKYFEGK